MTSFEFATATRIVFGAGTFAQLDSIGAGFGKRPFLVRGNHSLFFSSTQDFRVTKEPTIHTVREGVAAFRDHGCDMVIAIGGGSVIDAGKAIAAAAANPGDPLDYLEVIGKGQPLERTPYPFIAVPTTAGTGSEVTRNAVLGSPEHTVKVSLRSLAMLPKVAIVDPELTRDLPAAVTAASGLDALTQVIEPYVCLRANPFVDNICRDGMHRVAECLPRAFRNGDDADAREGMSYASLLGGMALANAGLGVVHGFAAPIGGMFDAPHGAICAALLPAGMKTNIAALRERDPEGPALERYAEVARIVTKSSDAGPEDGVEWVAQLVKQLAIPSLGAYGIGTEHAEELVAKAARANSMKANPVALTPAELTSVLEHSL